MNSEELLKEIGARLAKTRKEKGYTQEQLAELIEVTPQMISYAEKGRKAMRPENLIKICTTLDTSADYLLMGKETTSFGIFEKHFENLTNEQQIYIKLILDSCINLCQ